MIRPGMWALSLTAVLMLGLAQARDKSETPECSGHGTSIDFLDTPAEAARHARKLAEDPKKAKLVFILHVSGNFEDPRFT
jgi:hypothetical protein